MLRMIAAAALAATFSLSADAAPRVVGDADNLSVERGTAEPAQRGTGAPRSISESLVPNSGA